MTRYTSISDLIQSNLVTIFLVFIIIWLISIILSARWILEFLQAFKNSQQLSCYHNVSANEITLASAIVKLVKLFAVLFAAIEILFFIVLCQI